MFNAKRISVDAKYDLIAILEESDAKELSLHASERVKIIANNNFVICKLDIINSKTKDCPVKKGEIGIFEAAFDKLGITPNKKVSLAPTSKPKSLKFVNEKFDGKKLNELEFTAIIRDIIDNVYSEIETTYFVLACTIHKLDDKETVALTNAMVNVGKILDFKKKKTDIVVDKHCIGGLAANRTTMVVIPIIAAAGLKIPKSSSRAITSPAGTADTMEVLAKVDLQISEMVDTVNKTNGCIVWGGNLDLSPADDLIIQIEHPLEIDSEGQMIASILSKKKSAGSTHVLIDIPVGPTAKINNVNHAIKLKKRFEKIGRAIGLTLKVIITDGTQPIGNGIGPLYEANDVMAVLKNEKIAPKDLKEKSLKVAGQIFELAKISKLGEGYFKAKEILESNKAYEKFNDIINAQGKNTQEYKAKYKINYSSNKVGKVIAINNKLISKLAFILGAPESKSAGIILKKKLGDIVDKNETLFEMYSNSELKLKYANTFLEEHKSIISLK